MTQAQILQRIYPSIVTFMGDWKKMVRDVRRLKLEAISVFLTCAEKGERKMIYRQLLKTSVKRVPHVHARNDMKEDEFDFFARHYKTKAFTLHFQYLKNFKKSKYLKKIYIENNPEKSIISNLSELKKVGGVCIDLSHFIEHFHHNHQSYRIAQKAVSRYAVGCNHLSAVRQDGMSWHYVERFDELDYVGNIPKRYFSDNINIELANPILEQLKFRKYIAKILAKSGLSSHLPPNTLSRGRGIAGMNGREIIDTFPQDQYPMGRWGDL